MLGDTCASTLVKSLATMLVPKRQTGITPEVNLRNPLYTGEKADKQGQTQALKSRADIEVQNRVIRIPIKRAYVLQNFPFKKEKCRIPWNTFTVFSYSYGRIHPNLW